MVTTPSPARLAAGLRFRLVDLAGRVPRDPVLVLGNQKSGTTAIARLLAEATGSTYSHDMFYRRGWDDVDALHRGDLDVADLVRRSRWEFSRRVIKDPDLTFHQPALASRFDRARFVFVVRHPADNLRSILNRLGLPGDPEGAAAQERAVADLSPLWRAVLEPHALGLAGGDYVEVLAQRWTAAARAYLADPASMHLVRYEEFVTDKVGCIARLAGACGLPVTTDVSPLVDQQFQPRGDHSRTPEDFFGRHLDAVRRECGPAAARLGYDLDRPTA